ncbi:Nn.00g070120.m01.CDS01 [Neocucurbitaria sp. VM-36]
MLRRTVSAISLDTIDPDAEPYRDDWDEDGRPLTVGNAHDHQAEGDASLCARCHDFDLQSFARSATRRKGYLLKDVEISAQSGCAFCTLLLDAAKDAGKPEYFYTHAVFPGRTVTNPDLFVHMKISESYKTDQMDVRSHGLRGNRLLIEIGDRFSDKRNESKHEICLAADPLSPAALNSDIVGRYIGRNPSSDAHYETAQKWLQGCASHSKCNETVSGSTKIDPYGSPLPTRVIEVARENGQQRLYLRQTEGLHGAYITLTHRWNEFTGQCITTTENLEGRMLGGDFGPLPQLFHDAFVIAERMHVKYIWIDSICIVQKGDDLADWRREATRMAQYYQFSIFTLAGTAEDISAGILTLHGEAASPWASGLARLPYLDRKNTLAGHFYAYKRHTALVDEYMDQVRSSILFRRGWILQEWLLSKRILWYTPHGMFFECQQELPWSQDQSQLTYHRANPELRAHLQLKASFHHSNKDILDFWYHALEVYSGQHLTKPEMDRILAVAGLAKEVAPILANPKKMSEVQSGAQNEVYVAGLWLRDIFHGLLWEMEHAKPRSAGKVQELPSWSWASLMTQVKWPERCKGTKAAFTVTGICFVKRKQHDLPDQLVYENGKTRPSNPANDAAQFDPTNMFSCLHICGRLHTVHVRGYLDTDENLKRAALSTAYSPTPKSCDWRAICSAFRPDIIAGWGSLEQFESHPTACADFGVAVYALHVSTRQLRHGFWLKTTVPVLDVLFLEEVEGVSNVFRRLGVGRIADRMLIAEFEEAEERDIQLV